MVVKRIQLTFLVIISFIYCISLSKAAQLAVVSNNKCSDAILGCLDCDMLTKATQLLSETYSCSHCDSNLYLYKYFNPTSKTFTNICVPDCKTANFETANDEVSKQCVYLGPYCKYSQLVKNSVTGKEFPSCSMSFMENKGFVLGSRYQILNWLTKTATTANFNTTKTFSKSIEELRSNSRIYFEPTQNGTDYLIPETNLKVVAKCESQYCNHCESYNLTSCITCWGSGCQVCDYGWNLQYPNGNCINCTEWDNNCIECAGQKSQSSLRCTECKPGFGVDANGRCKQCTGSRQSQCFFDIKGIETLLLCDDGWVLSNDNSTCQRSCPLNEFPYVIFNQQTLVEEKIFCKACDLSCASCVSPGIDGCTSCKVTDTLSLKIDNGFKAIRGTCIPKPISIPGSSSSLYQIQVMNALNSLGIGSFTADGNRLQPNLMAAYFQAIEIASKMGGLKVEILLETGSHFITPLHIQAFQSSLDKHREVNINNAQLDLSITPLTCSKKRSMGLQYQSSNCKDPDTHSYNIVSLFNKAGAYFSLIVSKSLLFEGIQFDAMDSLVKSTSATTNVGIRDCFWYSSDSFNCPGVTDKSYMISPDTNPICAFRSFGSIFRFMTINANLTRTEDIQKLEIANCTFQNIFYEIGSIVRLPEHNPNGISDNEWPWNLTISNTVFNNMSFCGSVVANNFPTFEGTTGHHVSVFNDGHKEIINRNYMPPPQQYNMLLNCSQSDSSCFDLIFIDNTVQNLFMLKNPQGGTNYFTQKVNWQMEKMALVLQIHDFKGNVTFSRNKIEDIRINFKDFCLYTEDPNQERNQFSMRYATPWTSSLMSFNDVRYDKKSEFLIPNQNDAYQLHSLITIENLKEGKSVNIANNQIKGCITSSSLININQKLNSKIENQGYINVNGNLFQDSSAYIGTNAIIITNYFQKNTTDLVNSENYCGRGISVSENVFNRVIGTCQTDTGLVRIQCNNTIVDVQNQLIDEFMFINQTRQIASTHGQSSNKFNSSSLNSIYQQLQKGITKIQRNRIYNCSSGIAQQATRGNMQDETEFIQEFTGSLFSFQDLLRIDFEGNQISNMLPTNDFNFYTQNSPHFRYFGHTPVKLSNNPDRQQGIRVDKSSAIITAQNVYEFTIKNCSFSNVQATKFADAVVFHSQNGLHKLEVSNSSFSNLSEVVVQLFNTKDQLPTRNESEFSLSHSIIMTHCIFSSITIKPKVFLSADALVFDNFQGNFPLQSFEARNVSISGVKMVRDSEIDKNLQTISTLLHVSANNISLVEINVNDIQLQQKKDDGSPIKLKITNVTPSSTLQPKIWLQSCRFKNIETKQDFEIEVVEGMPSKGALFTMFHDQTDYDIIMLNSTFDSINMYFTKIKKMIEEIPLVEPVIASLLRVESSTNVTMRTAQMQIQIKDCIMKDIFYARANGMKRELLHFNKPIKRLEIDNTQFTGFEKAWSTNQEGNTTQAIQTFSPENGPQQVIISNMRFETPRIQDLNQLHQLMIQETVFNKTSTKTEFQTSDFSSRFFFDIQDYNYSPDSKQSNNKQMVKFYNISVLNIDFMDIEDQQYSKRGSFIRTSRSNLDLELMMVANLSSKGNGAFLHVYDDGQQNNINPYSTSIMIIASNITNCTSYEGGAIYYSGMSKNRQEQLLIESSNLIGNFAAKSGAISIETEEANIIITKVIVKGNIALFENSFGKFSNPGQIVSLLENLQVRNNKVLYGSSTILIQNTSMKISKSEFVDNVAVKLTHGIKMEGSYPSDFIGIHCSLTIDSSLFAQSSYITQTTQDIMGSYILIENSTILAGQIFKPKLKIHNSIFRLGHAKQGGAIFVNGMNQISLELYGSQFENNVADLNGGAIFLDNLDEYNINVSSTEFIYNNCRLYGDNLFARQTKSSKTTADSTSSQRRLLQEQSPPSRQIVINDTQFTTPMAGNQLYLESINSVILNKLQFKPIQDSQAIEGASIFCLNCYQFYLNNSSFDYQSSIIRGGAIFLRQTSQSYFGRNWSDSVHTISNSNFTKCVSQQGGVLYTKNVMQTVIGTGNRFLNNEVLLYGQRLSPQAQLQSQYKKVFEPLLIQSQRGKGPVFYFDCPITDSCQFKVLEGQFFNQSRVFDTRSSKYVEYLEEDGKRGQLQLQLKKLHDKQEEDKLGVPPMTTTDAKSIFYTGAEPIVPSSLNNIIEESFYAIYNGTKISLFTNQTEYQKFLNESEVAIYDQIGYDYRLWQIMEVSDVNGSLFSDSYSLNDFQVRNSTIFGDNAVAIVNDQNIVQIYDSQSELKIQVQQSEGSPVVEVFLVENQPDSSVFNITAKNGIFYIPKIKIQATPSQSVILTLSLTLYDETSNFTQTTQNLTINTRACKAGEIITKNGTCKVCVGPDSYLVSQTRISDSTLKIQECKVCNKAVFTCHGGDQIQAKEGYQRLDNLTDSFIKCDHLLGSSMCFANNSCAKGYQGLMCKQCAGNFFRDFDGQCKMCSMSDISTVTYSNRNFFLFRMIFNWFIIILCLKYLIDMAFKSQQKNILSTGVYLFKNIVNYVLFITLLSQIFDSYWMSDVASGNGQIKPFVETIRTFYRVPLKSVDYQCVSSNLSKSNMRISTQQLKSAGPPYLAHIGNVTVVPDLTNLLTGISADNAKVSLSSERRQLEVLLLSLLLTVLGVAKLIQHFFSPFPDNSKTADELELEQHRAIDEENDKTNVQLVHEETIHVSGGYDLSQNENRYSGQPQNQEQIKQQAVGRQAQENQNYEGGDDEDKSPEQIQIQEKIANVLNSQDQLNIQDGSSYARGRIVNLKETMGDQINETAQNLVDGQDILFFVAKEGNGSKSQDNEKQRFKTMNNTNQRNSQLRQISFSEYPVYTEAAKQYVERAADAELGPIQISQQSHVGKGPSEEQADAALRKQRQQSTQINQRQENLNLNSSHQQDNHSQIGKSSMRRSVMGRSVGSGKSKQSGNSNKSEIETNNASKKAERLKAARNLRAKMKRHQFDPSSLRLMLFAFLFNTQVIGQLMLTFNCQNPQVITGSTLALSNQGFNIYDSSIICLPSDIFSSSSFVFTIIYIICWTIIAPIYVLRKAGREFVIDAVGLIVKVIMLGLAIYRPFITELQSGVLAALIMIFQFVIFMVFKNGQAHGNSEKLRKLGDLNLLDFWMYLTLTITSLLSMCFILLQKKHNDWDINTDTKINSYLCIMIFCVNLVYVFFWIFRVFRYGMKHLRISPRYSHIYRCLICSSSTETENKVNTEGYQGSQRLDDSENNEDLEKLDMMIQHLENVQQDIVQGNMPNGAVKSEVVNYGKTGYIDQDQLLDDIHDILNIEADDSERMSVESRDPDQQTYKQGEQRNCLKQGHIEIVAPVNYMDQEDLIDSDEGDDGIVTQSRNENYKSDSPQPLVSIDRQTEGDNPLKENARVEIQKQLKTHWTNAESLFQKEQVQQPEPSSLIDAIPKIKDQLMENNQADQIKVEESFEENPQQVSFFNNTFSQNDLPLALKDLKDENENENPILAKLKLDLMNIDYKNAIKNDYQIMDDMDRNARSIGASTNYPSKRRLQESQSHEAITSEPIVQSEIQKMMMQLNFLNASIRLSNKYEDNNVNEPAEIQIQTEDDNQSVHEGVKSEIQKMMEQLNSLNEGMKSRNDKETSGIEEPTIKNMDQQPQISNKNTVAEENYLNGKIIQEIPIEEQKYLKIQESDEAQDYIKKKSKSMKDDLRRKAVEIKELQKKRRELKESQKQISSKKK